MGRDLKTPLEKMAEALVVRDALRLRELFLEWRRHRGGEEAFAAPRSKDARVLAAAGALAELLAERENLPVPSWAARAGSFERPFFALAAAERFKNVRELCERESPAALRRHGVLAPANFLEVA
ncbi:MAG: hypothetical protein AB1405_01395 [Bdellovibrionota bacterium]